MTLSDLDRMTEDAQRLGLYNVPAPTMRVRESDAVLEQRAISMLTDDQAMASFIRWRTGAHGDVECVSMRDQMGVSEYVDAIFAKVPE